MLKIHLKLKYKVLEGSLIDIDVGRMMHATNEGTSIFHGFRFPL